MTKWKQRRLERERLVQEVAVAVTPVFLDLILTESLKARASHKDVLELRQTVAESAWAHGEVMARVKQRGDWK